MTSAVIGIGTLLKVGDGATPTEAFTTIAEVKSISGPSETRDTLDVTNMDSPNQYKEFVATLIDGGTISCDINFIGDNTTQNGLRTDMLAGTARNFQLLMANTGASLYAFTAFVTEFSPSFDVESIVTASISMKITGAVTFTP